MADNTELIGLNFTYNGGTTPLAWYDNGGSCQYSNGSYLPLYDLPQAAYYINGLVDREPLVADFSASNTLPQVSESVSFTDLSTGGPLTWAWSSLLYGFLCRRHEPCFPESPGTVYRKREIHGHAGGD
ncbi:MAG: hypothetical protein MZV63_56210 [Marinilabiliales bacterium]|nr:hypothetical protein [Marinilabiliales bacterium]